MYACKHNLYLPSVIGGATSGIGGAASIVGGAVSDICMNVSSYHITYHISTLYLPSVVGGASAVVGGTSAVVGGAVSDICMRVCKCICRKKDGSANNAYVPSVIGAA